MRRLGQALFVVWAAFTLTFIILFALPGDAVTQKFGISNYIPPEQYDALKAHYGLNLPWYQQYFNQLTGFLHGNLGISVSTGKPVAQLIGEAFPQTLQLAALALGISLVVGTVIALFATITHSSALRQLLFSLPALGSSLPGFWIGLMMLWAFSFTWKLFPAYGNNGFVSMVLPALTLSVHCSAGIAQILARSLDDEWSSGYVDTARAKGLGRWAIQLRHVLRNALVPVSTAVAMMIGSLLAGTVICETIYSRNGIGRLTQIAVTDQDIPVVQAVVVLSAAVFAVVNLIVDLLYPVLDPRILGWRKGV